MTEKMIKTAEVAALLGIVPRSISNWLRNKPDFPKPIVRSPKGGASNYWLYSDIQAYILGKKAEPKDSTSHQAAAAGPILNVAQEQILKSPALAADTSQNLCSADSPIESSAAASMPAANSPQQFPPLEEASQLQIHNAKPKRGFQPSFRKQRVMPPVEARRAPITDINRSDYPASAPAEHLPPVSQQNPAPIEQPDRVIVVVQQVVRPPPIFRFEGEPPLKNLSQSQAAQQLINPRPTFRFRDEPVSGSPSPSEVEPPVRERHEERYGQYEEPRTSLEEFHKAMYQEAMSGELSDDAIRIETPDEFDELEELNAGVQRIETPDEFDELEESGHEYDQGLDEEPSDEDK